MRTKIEQEKFKRLKTLRAAIRLQHSLDAEDDINELIDAEILKFDAAVQKGKLPEPLNVRKALNA